MQMKTLVLGMFGVNCYLYWDKTTGDGVLIDPGDDFPTIKREITAAGFRPQAILLTHGHADHIGAVDAAKKEYGVPIYIGKGEEHMLTDPNANLSTWTGTPIIAPPADVLLNEGETIQFGSISFAILSTPGHSPASICFYDTPNDVLFCGDALFNGSIGRTDFPGCSLDRLLKGIEEKILTLADDTRCYPGHGPATTVGAERKNNPFLLGRYHG